MFKSFDDRASGNEIGKETLKFMDIAQPKRNMKLSLIQQIQHKNSTSFEHTTSTTTVFEFREEAKRLENDRDQWPVSEACVSLCLTNNINLFSF